MRFITTLKAGCPVFMLRFLRASNIKIVCNDFILFSITWDIIVSMWTAVHNFKLHTPSPCFAYLAYLGMQEKKCCAVSVFLLLAYLAYLYIIFVYIDSVPEGPGRDNLWGTLWKGYAKVCKVCK